MKRILLTILLSLVFVTTAFAAEFPAADPAEFAGKTIAVVTGSMQEQWAVTDFPDSQRVYYSSFPDATLAVESGKADALFFSDVPLRYTVGEKEGLEILTAGKEEIPVAPIFVPNEKGDKLREQFNEYLARIRADGTLAGLEKKWVDGPEELREFDDPSEPPDVNGKINIITQSGAAPFDYEKNGRMYGCEIEVVREFCRAYGYQPVFYDATMDATIMGVHTGKYDMGASALMITEERAKSVNFAEPVFYCRGALLVKKGIYKGISSGETETVGLSPNGSPMAVLSEFDGKTIGLTAGTTQEAIAQEIFKDPVLAYYGSLPDAMIALESGKIDAFFGDDLGLIYAAGRTEGTTVLCTGGDPIEASLVFQKTERGEKLRDEFNAFLAKYRESGQLEALTRKWYDGPEEARVMDVEAPTEGKNGTIVVAAEVGYAPCEYMKDGELVGFEIELIYAFCREYGYTADIYNTVFDSLIMGVYTGKFDIAASGLTMTEERKKSVNFGDAYLTSYGGLLVRKDGGWTGASAETASETAPGASEGQGDDSSESGTAASKKGFLETVAEGFRRTFIEEGRWQLFASGMWVTLVITVLSVLFGTAVGFVLYLLCRNGNRAANAIVGASKWFITGMPLVVFLMVLFYIVFAKSSINGTAVAVVGFTIVFGFTMFDLMKSGEGAIDVGQKEAAYALGYSDIDAFLRIILPQAAMHFMPSYLGEVVSLVKATAVVGYITVMDVTKIGDIVRGRTYDAIFPLLAVVIAYFLLSAIIKALIRVAIRKIDTKSRPKEEIMKGVEIR